MSRQCLIKMCYSVLANRFDDNCFEIAISLYKLVQGQWTKRLAIGNTILQIAGAGTIVFIIIVINPHIFTDGFITFVANVFTISPEELKKGLIGRGILIYVLSAALNIYDGFRKASVCVTNR